MARTIDKTDLTATHRREQEAVYLRVATDLRAIGHPELAAVVDWEREVLWGILGAPEPVGIIRP